MVRVVKRIQNVMWGVMSRALMDGDCHRSDLSDRGNSPGRGVQGPASTCIALSLMPLMDLLLRCP